jgi:hypothetical protein
MQAKELVTIIEEYNPDWSRQAILNEIEYVQRIMYNHPTMLSRAYSNETEGVTDPLFTVDENNEVVVSDAFRVEKAYYDDPNCPIEIKTQNNIVRFKDNLAYIPDPVDPILNPPVKEVKVRIRYYKTALLTGELMDLLIPDQYIDMLEAGVTERLAFKEHGDRQGFVAWRRRELPSFWAGANRDFRFNEDSDTGSDSSNPYGA